MHNFIHLFNAKKDKHRVSLKIWQGLEFRTRGRLNKLKSRGGVSIYNMLVVCLIKNINYSKTPGAGNRELRFTFLHRN